jgi:ABC-2 type transport system ATP-binding protein
MTALLDIAGLHHAYGAHSVLRGIDLTIEAGEFLALIGPNGSGKTTLLRLISGLLGVQRGRVAIAGIDLSADLHGARGRLGFGVDPTLLPGPLSGAQVLRLFAEARGLPDIPASTHALCESLAFTPWFDRMVEDYSLGTRQKLGILAGLIGDPPLLVLDEPLNGLDPLSAYALKQELVRRTRELGTAVLFATHALEVAERFINRAVLLLDGGIARQWSAAELAALRADPSRSLEDEMIETLRPNRTPAERAAIVSLAG